MGATMNVTCIDHDLHHGGFEVYRSDSVSSSYGWFCSLRDGLPESCMAVRVRYLRRSS